MESEGGGEWPVRSRAAAAEDGHCCSRRQRFVRFPIVVFFFVPLPPSRQRVAPLSRGLDRSGLGGSANGGVVALAGACRGHRCHLLFHPPIRRRPPARHPRPPAHFRRATSVHRGYRRQHSHWVTVHTGYAGGVRVGAQVRVRSRGESNATRVRRVGRVGAQGAFSCHCSAGPTIHTADDPRFFCFLFQCHFFSPPLCVA